MSYGGFIEHNGTGKQWSMIEQRNQHYVEDMPSSLQSITKAMNDFTPQTRFLHVTFTLVIDGIMQHFRNGFAPT